MRKKRDYHQILYEDYPDIHNLWAEAANADLEACAQHEMGNYEEAERLSKIHKELWAEYQLAAACVLSDHEELK